MFSFPSCIITRVYYIVAVNAITPPSMQWPQTAIRGQTNVSSDCPSHPNNNFCAFANYYNAVDCWSVHKHKSVIRSLNGLSRIWNVSVNYFYNLRRPGERDRQIKIYNLHTTALVRPCIGKEVDRLQEEINRDS